MITEQERNQLMDEYRRPVSVARLLLTCAGGLLVVIALALFGLEMDLFGSVQPGQVSAQHAP